MTIPRIYRKGEATLRKRRSMYDADRRTFTVDVSEDDRDVIVTIQGFDSVQACRFIDTKHGHGMNITLIGRESMAYLLYRFAEELASALDRTEVMEPWTNGITSTDLDVAIMIIGDAIQGLGRIQRGESLADRFCRKSKLRRVC